MFARLFICSMLLALAAVPSFAQQQKICGTVQQYFGGGATSDWKNLPGCTGDTTNRDAAVAGMSAAKEACGKYFEAWLTATPADARKLSSLEMAGGTLRHVCTGGMTVTDSTNGDPWTKDKKLRAGVTVERNGERSTLSAVQAYQVWDRFIDALDKSAELAEKLQRAYDDYNSTTDASLRNFAVSHFIDAQKEVTEAKVGVKYIDIKLRNMTYEQMYKSLAAKVEEDQAKAKEDQAKSAAAAQEARARSNAVWDALKAEIPAKASYINAFANGAPVYTYRGVPVRTPDDFRNATALFRCFVDDRKSPPVWTLSGTLYKANRDVGPYTDTGVGNNCPTRAYPTADPN
jgi:hypothetical protein